MAEGEGKATSAEAVPASADDSAALGFVMDVPLRVTVEVGSARMLLREVLQLDKASVVELDRGADEPSDVLINGRVVARGEVTVVGDKLGVRIVELLESPIGNGRQREV